MFFRRKVDDPPWTNQLRVCSDHHLADLHPSRIRGFSVGTGVLWEGLAKHECDALPHHTNFVDGVDESLYWRFKQVTRGIANHQK